MLFSQLFSYVKWILAGGLLYALLYGGQALIERTHCVDGTSRCVTIKGPWMRVASVEHPGEIVLVEKWWLIRQRRGSAKFAFFDEPLSLRGQPAAVAWGSAEQLVSPQRIWGRTFDGLYVYYLPACELVVDCDLNHRCSASIVKVAC